MTIRPFTDEEMLILKGNPYTQSVTRNSIQFTPLFRYLFKKMARRGGRGPIIFLTYGYNPEILGRERVEYLTFRFTSGLDDVAEAALRKKNNLPSIKGVKVFEITWEEFRRCKEANRVRKLMR